MSITAEQRKRAYRLAAEAEQDMPAIADIIRAEVADLASDDRVGPFLAGLTGLPESSGRKAAAAAAATPPVDPRSVVMAARKDPSFERNVETAIMNGVDPALAEVRALVAYANRTGQTGFLTFEEYNLLPKGEADAVWSRFGPDVIRDAAWDELSPGEQQLQDIGRWTAENPESPQAKRFAELARWEGMTPEERKADDDGKALLQGLREQYEDAARRERDLKSGVEVAGLGVRITASSAPDAVKAAARYYHGLTEAERKAEGAREAAETQSLEQVRRDVLQGVNASVAGYDD